MQRFQSMLAMRILAVGEHCRFDRKNCSYIFAVCWKLLMTRLSLVSFVFKLRHLGSCWLRVVFTEPLKFILVKVDCK